MALLKGLKANKAINILLDDDGASPAEIKEAVSSLKQIGASAVPKLIDALEEDSKNPHILNLLTTGLDNASLHHYTDGLAHPNNRVMTHISQIMAQSNTYDVNRLFELLDDPEIPKNALLQIIVAHKERVQPARLFEQLAEGSKAAQQMAFRVLEYVADERSIPDLLRFIEHPDPNIRVQLIKVLSQFKDNMAVRDALLKMLGDKQKHVRQAAVDALGRMTARVPSQPLVKLLRDPDITTQNKAIEALSRIRDPDTVGHLIEILQDESEYVRRAAVEVLNEIGDQRAVKDLLNALRDADWWIRARAADALGSIGGPKVIAAVLELIKEKDEFLRRTAVEILNSIKDERAFDHLVAALDDSDWWVRERAADALAGMGDQRAIPALLKMVAGHPESEKVGIACLKKLAEPETLNSMIQQADYLDDSVRSALMSKLAGYDVAPPPADAPTNLDDIENAPTQFVASGSNPSRARNPAPQGPTDATLIQSGTKPAEMAPETAHGGGFIDPAELKPGVMIDNRYKVIRKVGEGAFGVVMLVHDAMVDEEIILKFLNAQVASDKHIIQRFVQELRYARKITHENVIRIFDFINIGKSCAISMEYFDSHSLGYEIKAKKTGDHARMIKILIEVCNGLSYAHRAGVVHRDIKPANILIDENDVVKLVDFGLAAAASHTDARLTRSGVLVGTPTYMAPEQVRDKKIDARTDIYSLGVLMYEVFTGKPPYRGKDSMAILFQHVEGKAKPPKSQNPEISDELNAIIMKAMSVNPDRRYQTVDELRGDLARALIKAGG